MRGAGRFYAAAALVGIVATLPLTGCQSEEARSLPGVQAWVARLEEFYHRHQRWPDHLEDLQEGFDTPEELQQALHNPVTGQHPGYEYVKPPDWVRNTPLAERVVILYQLREGRRAHDLPVGYANGQVRLLRSTDITQTQAHWQPFRPPEAPVEVAFPTPPVRDAAPEARSAPSGSADTEPPAPATHPETVCTAQGRHLGYQRTFRAVVLSGQLLRPAIHAVWDAKCVVVSGSPRGPVSIARPTLHEPDQTAAGGNPSPPDTPNPESPRFGFGVGAAGTPAPGPTPMVFGRGSAILSLRGRTGGRAERSNSRPIFPLLPHPFPLGCWVPRIGPSGEDGR